MNPIVSTLPTPAATPVASDGRGRRGHDGDRQGFGRMLAEEVAAREPGRTRGAEVDRSEDRGAASVTPPAHGRATQHDAEAEGADLPTDDGESVAGAAPAAVAHAADRAHLVADERSALLREANDTTIDGTVTSGTDAHTDTSPADGADPAITLEALGTGTSPGSDTAEVGAAPSEPADQGATDPDAADPASTTAVADATDADTSDNGDEIVRSEPRANDRAIDRAAARSALSGSNPARDADSPRASDRARAVAAEAAGLHATEAAGLHATEAADGATPDEAADAGGAAGTTASDITAGITSGGMTGAGADTNDAAPEQTGAGQPDVEVVDTAEAVGTTDASGADATGADVAETSTETSEVAAPTPSSDRITADGPTELGTTAPNGVEARSRPNTPTETAAARPSPAPVFDEALAEALRPAIANFRLRADGAQELRIQLHTDDGLPIEVDLRRSGDEIRVVLSGEAGETLARLGDARDRLAADLRRAGIGLASLDVRADGGHRDPDNPGTPTPLTSVDADDMTVPYADRNARRSTAASGAGLDLDL